MIHDPPREAWQPLSSAPRNGTVIDLTWMDGGEPQEIWPMRWSHIQRNPIFPGVVGMWVAPDGSVTWNEADPRGAPTHWRPVVSNRTIIEINHDLAHVVDSHRFEFCNLLASAVGSGNQKYWEELQWRFGLSFIASGHHSEDLAERCRTALRLDAIRAEERSKIHSSGNEP